MISLFHLSVPRLSYLLNIGVGGRMVINHAGVCAVNPATTRVRRIGYVLGDGWHDPVHGGSVRPAHAGLLDVFLFFLHFLPLFPLGSFWPEGHDGPGNAASGRRSARKDELQLNGKGSLSQSAALPFPNYESFIDDLVFFQCRSSNISYEMNSPPTDIFSVFNVSN